MNNLHLVAIWSLFFVPPRRVQWLWARTRNGVPEWCCEPAIEDESGCLADGATLIGTMGPGLRPDLVEALAERPITAPALGWRPRRYQRFKLWIFSSI